MTPLRLALRHRWAVPGLILSAALIGSSPADVRAQEATPTPTTPATLVPTATATATLAAAPTAGTDNCRGTEREPNDEVPSCLVAVGGSVAGQIDRREDRDGFAFYAKAGRIYRISVLPSTTRELDPRLKITRPDGLVLAEQDDRAPGDPSAVIDVRTDREDFIWMEVSAASVITGTYTLQVEEAVPTTTPSPTATATATATRTPAPTATAAPTSSPLPGAQLGSHQDYPHAYALQMGQAVADHVAPGESDWWAIRVKPGVTYTCSVSLGQQTFDPVMRVEQDGRVIAANDDRSAADVTPLVTWKSASDGIAFPIVESMFGAGDYKLMCASGAETPVPAQSGAGGSGSQPTTLPSPTWTPTRVSTAEAAGPSALDLRFFPLGQPLPPTAALTQLDFIIYYDRNGSQAPEPGEGIEGLSLRALARGQFVGWSMTDSQGRARIVVSGAIERVGAPFLNLYETVSPGETRTIVWRIPAVNLPTFLQVDEQP